MLHLILAVAVRTLVGVGAAGILGGRLTGLAAPTFILHGWNYLLKRNSCYYKMVYRPSVALFDTT